MSGQILTDACGDHKTTQWFLEDTVPTELCSVHSNQTNSSLAISRLEKEMYQSGQRRTLVYDTTPLVLNLDFLSDDYDFSKSSSTESYDYDYNDSDSSSSVSDDIDYNYLME